MGQMYICFTLKDKLEIYGQFLFTFPRRVIIFIKAEWKGLRKRTLDHVAMNVSHTTATATKSHKLI